MTLLSHPWPACYLPTDGDQQRFAAALEGLYPAPRETLLRALSQVDPQTIGSWLETGTLREWVKQGLHILAEKGERAELLATSFFAATQTILPVLTQGEIGEWVRLGLDIEAADRPGVFSVLPDGFAALPESERLSLYRLARASAYRSPQVAAALYRSLPRSLQTLSAPLRRLLVRCLQAAAAFDPDPLPALLPLLGPTLRSLPSESQAPLLERIAQLAQTFPAGVARLFRALTRAYDGVGEEGVKTWIVAGEEIARRNPQAGEAFFALESRTSLLTLRHASPAVSLSDVQGLLLKYLHMLCGAAVSLTETDSLSFPPPLAEAGGDILPLPDQVEMFPAYQETFRAYLVLGAHQAGRLEFGTYNLSLPRLWPFLPNTVRELAEPEGTPPDDLAAYFRLFPQPEQIEALFLVIESRRIAACLAAGYRGLREDLTWAESLTHLLPPALSAFLPHLPDSFRPDLGGEATVVDSLLLATEIYAARMHPGRRPASLPQSAAQPENLEAAEEDAQTMLVEIEEDNGQGGTPLSAEEQDMLRKIIAALRAHPGKKRIPRKKVPASFIEMPADSAEVEEPEEPKNKKKSATERRLHTAAGLRYLYDEWDYLIEDYRAQWCQLREIPLAGDDGAFFSRTLAMYEHLTPDIKREFQRLRPRMYRQVKGLEDGEEIDLDAAVAARVDLRTGIAPSPKLYAARQPLAGHVAALFLLDMSASTDARLAEREGARIIDVMKEAVALLSAALEDIGDVYAIYGFSSHGRRNVEVYPVKTFADTLSAEVKGRTGATAPTRSTRIGAAVRDATRELKDLSCRARLLVLLSDGCPVDAVYWPEKH